MNTSSSMVFTGWGNSPSIYWNRKYFSPYTPSFLLPRSDRCVLTKRSIFVCAIVNLVGNSKLNAKSKSKKLLHVERLHVLLREEFHLHQEDPQRSEESNQHGEQHTDRTTLHPPATTTWSQKDDAGEWQNKMKKTDTQAWRIAGGAV